MTRSSTPTPRRPSRTTPNAGPIVTHEWIPNFGHSDALAKNEMLKNFLLDHGPLKAVKANLAAAKAAQKAGRLGEAYTGFSGLAGMAATAECTEAADAAKALAADAEKRLTDAKAAADAKNYSEAVKIYSAAAAAFAASPFADKAREALKALESDPTVGPAMAQAKIDAEAAVLEAKAQAAEAAKDYSIALKLYAQYVESYPKATRFAEVKAHLEAMKKDPAIIAASTEKDAERDCRTWLKMAENFLAADRADKAREYLKKILDTYPGTTWAAKATAMMDKIPAS